MAPQPQLAEAFISWLALMRWDWFATLTFRSPIHHNRAWTRFTDFMADLNKSSSGQAGWFVVQENTPTGDRPHFHVVITGVSHLKRSQWAAEWLRRNGHADIKQFEPSQNALAYLSLKIGKQNADWRVHGQMQPLSQADSVPQSLSRGCEELATSPDNITAGQPITGQRGGLQLARRRYQRGSLSLVKKRSGEQLWQGRWREDELLPDGTVRRINRKQIIGTRKEFPTERLAQRELDARLANINSTDYRPQVGITFAELDKMLSEHLYEIGEHIENLDELMHRWKADDERERKTLSFQK